MKVKIIETKTKSEIKSKISLVSKKKVKLPSINDGWSFNFSKHSKVKDYESYILTTDKTPEVIEGCLIINTKTPFQVYMAFVEIAPHNKGNKKKHDSVAGCLIAFACRQSFIKGKEGYLVFDVIEEKKENEIKLMTLYSQKYNAVRYDDSTTMIILPEGSEKLINEFL
ncbi:MAG: hypothetical protein COB60_10870 [Flavobacteriaceae bacterium]|nr:MAG: hypothetical protein COB60_10870 [Flavobacteriaceae bacterium]